MLARDLGLPHLDLEAESVPDGARSLFPKAYWIEKRAAPVRLDDSNLRLVMVDPLDIATIKAVAQASGRYIEVAVGDLLEIRALVDRSFSEE